MEPTTPLSQLRVQLSQLENRSFAEHEKAITRIGNYFYETKPSEIDEVYVKETEGYFNNLFIQMKKFGYDPDLTETIRIALGSVSAQCKKIQIKDYQGEYFGDYKLIGDALIKIGRRMEQVKDKK